MTAAFYFYDEDNTRLGEPVRHGEGHPSIRLRAERVGESHVVKYRDTVVSILEYSPGETDYSEIEVIVSFRDDGGFEREVSFSAPVQWAADEEATLLQYRFEDPATAEEEKFGPDAVQWTLTVRTKKKLVVGKFISSSPGSNGAKVYARTRLFEGKRMVHEIRHIKSHALDTLVLGHGGGKFGYKNPEDNKIINFNRIEFVPANASLKAKFHTISVDTEIEAGRTVKTVYKPAIPDYMDKERDDEFGFSIAPSAVSWTLKVKTKPKLANAI